jgi:hypothetical protein
MKTTCPDCSGEIKVDFGQSIVAGELRWYASYTCEQCPYAEEVDGSGRLPDDLRASVLERGGKWTLRIVSFGSDPAQALKAIRTVFGSSLDEVKRHRAQLSTNAASGTKVEMEYLKLSLLRQYEEIEIRIEREPTKIG